MNILTSIKNYVVRYPRWSNAPGRYHATIYISPELPDVVTYGVRTVHKNTILPIVVFSGFEADEEAGAVDLRHLAEAMGMMINHAAKQCRLPVNHSGSIANKFRKHVEDGTTRYKILSIPIFMRITEERQQYITLKIWENGTAQHSVFATIPKLTFWDIPTMAQFERIAFYAAELAISERP